jgi:ABC-2 type transport system permease protein
MKWGIKVMPSKTSWFNKEVVLQGFRSAGWLGIIYFLALFFALPLRFMMLVSDEENMYNYNYYYDTNNLFTWNQSILTTLSVIVPVLVAIFIFRYLQMKASSDLFHSLPVKRKYLFHHFIGIGTFLVIMPVVLNMVILLFIHPALDLSEFFPVQSILYWAGVTIVINLLILMASVFVGMLTGISIVQGVLSYVFLSLPVGICLLLSFSLDMFLYGFSSNYYTGSGIEKLTPLSRVFMLIQNSFSQLEAWIYIGLSILLVILSLFIYKKRKLEAVSNPLVFPFLRPIFKYGMTFCSMLLGGLYFGEVQNSLGWTIFGYIVGSIIGYLVAEMFLQKTWRVLGNVKGYMFFVLVTAVLYLLIHFDVTGYEGKIPQLDEVERIHYSSGSHYYRGDSELPVQFFYEEENMNHIIKLHHKILEDKAINKANTRNHHSVFFAYELKNGKKLIREYNIPLNEEYKTYLKPIYESLEYKNVIYRAMLLEAPNVEKITLSPGYIGSIHREVTITDPAEMTELLTLLKEDIKNEKYEEVINNSGVVSEMRFSLKADQDIQNEYHNFIHATEYHHSIKVSYSSILDWLKEKGKYEEAVLTGDDFEYALELGEEIVDVNEYYSLSNEAMIEKLNNLENTVKITNKEDILEAWTNSHGDYSKGIDMVFKFKDANHIEFRVINENQN